MEVPKNQRDAGPNTLLISLEEWNGQFLLDLGYPSGRGLGRALDWGRKILGRGAIDRAGFIAN